MPQLHNIIAQPEENKIPHSSTITSVDNHTLTMAFLSFIPGKQIDKQEDNNTISAGYEDIDASSPMRARSPSPYMAYFHGTSLGYENVDLEAAMSDLGGNGARNFAAPGYSIYTVGGLLLLFGFVVLVLIYR